MAALSHLHATGFAKTNFAEFPGQERLKVIEITDDANADFRRRDPAQERSLGTIRWRRLHGDGLAWLEDDG